MTYEKHTYHQSGSQTQNIQNYVLFQCSLWKEYILQHEIKNQQYAPTLEFITNAIIKM